MSAKLTPEEEEFVKLARKLAAERAAQRPEDQVPMPEKFNGPVGMDDAGNLFPVPPTDAAPDAPPAATPPDDASRRRR